MNILVTGSSGFIGKALVEELRRLNHNVIEFSHSNGNDITNAEDVKNAVKNAEAIYHLAASLDEQDPKIFEINE